MREKLFILCRLVLYMKKKETKKPSKIPASYENRFYKTLGDPFDKTFDTLFQRDAIKNAPSEDVRNYLLATSDFGKGMQDDIIMYVIRDRLNNASFRQKLDPIAKNIFRRQNPLELVFKDNSTFDAQNPIIGSLLTELELGKKDTESSLIKKASNTKDVEIKTRLEELKRFNDGNDNSNTNLPLPTLPPYQPPPPPPQPPSFYFLPLSPPPPPTSF